jgi:hypothetical protein
LAAQIAHDSFVDNMANQVIERHLMRDLQSLFALDMTDDEVEKVAAEDPAKLRERERLEGELKNLKEGLNVCERGDGL